MNPVKGIRAVRGLLERFGVVDEAMARSINSKKTMTEDDIKASVDVRNQLMSEQPPGGKSIHDMSLDELAALGDEHGVNLRLSPIERVTDPETGRVWELPGGLNRESPLTLLDAHWLQSQGYDPNMMSDAFQAQLQQKMLDATTPAADQNYKMFNQLLFGLQSPNTPLLANQFQTARMRVRNEDDLDRLAGLIDWNKGDTVPKRHRQATDKAIGKEYGIQGAADGGIAFRSSVDLTNAAELAQAFKDHPEIFVKPDNMPWDEHAERVLNQLRGLSPKTATFGSVWQDPGAATISAMDRHMARRFRPDVMNSELGDAARAQRVSLWNSQLDKGKELRAKAKLTKDEKTTLKSLPPEGSTPVVDYDEIVSQPGGDDWDLDQIISDTTNHVSGQYRMADGTINPRVPEHLRDLAYEPTEFIAFGPTYRHMLDKNEEMAREVGLSTFGEQWRLWDRIRGRIEPHMAMHKDAQALPPLSAGELKHANETLKGAKYSGAGQVHRYPWQQGLYWGAGSMGLLGAMGADNEAMASMAQENPEQFVGLFNEIRNNHPVDRVLNNAPGRTHSNAEYNMPWLGNWADRVDQVQTPGELMNMPHAAKVMRGIAGDGSKIGLGDAFFGAMEMADPLQWPLLLGAANPRVR